MPYVIAQPCQSACDTSCVDVCPVDAIHGPRSMDAIRELSMSERAAERPALQLYIDPESCICCGACEPECPVEAIFDEDDLPAPWKEFAEINARHFRGR